MNIEPTVVTPIEANRLKLALANHPDKLFVDRLCSELQHGAHIGYEGPRAPRSSKNLPSATANPSMIDENLGKEVALGRTAGPFASPPFKNFQVSPIGLVPKKHSGKFRTIFHLSYPKSGNSINSYIDKDNFSLQYVTIDRVIQAILKLGQGCFMAKTDIEAAFRQFPVHPDDWELLGMQWKGKYYFDKVLPFGLRSAPFKFNGLSQALEWIALYELLISFVDHILDDFIIGEPTESECSTSLRSLLIMFHNLGVPTAPGKTIGPTQVIEFLGILLDSIKLEARLPQDKIERIRDALCKWECRKSSTLKELQSLIGTLNFACKVVPPGRPFLQRMIALTKGLTKPHHHVRLNNGFREDLRMWKQFIVNWNGTNMFMNEAWEDSNTMALYTDASGTEGFGGIYGKEWFQGRWQPHQMLTAPGISIDWQELYAILVACSIWGASWSQKRISFWCDNQPVVHMLNTKRSKEPKIMVLIRELTLLTMQHNFYFKVKHIEGVHNTKADPLSRFQMNKFRLMAPEANVSPEEIPQHLLVL